MTGIDTKTQQERRYGDFYSPLPLADFLVWIHKHDGSEPDISRIQGHLPPKNLNCFRTGAQESWTTTPWALQGNLSE
jgi:hypothetical protein